MNRQTQPKLPGLQPGRQYNALPGRKESAEQEALFEWIERQGKYQFPVLKRLFHIPNGGWREKGVGKALQRQGVKPGVLDLQLPVPIGIYHGCWIEMKIDNEEPSEDQWEWIEFLISMGYFVKVCWDMEQARDTLLSYLRGEC